jgi:hypothetical protein
MLDGVGIIVAIALLAVKFFRKGNDTLAASFFAAESLVLSDTAAGRGEPPVLASGVALWAASLVMTSLIGVFPEVEQVTGLVAAALFTVTAVKIAFGDAIVATSAPLPSAGYPFLVLTFAGGSGPYLRRTRARLRPKTSRLMDDNYFCRSCCLMRCCSRAAAEKAATTNRVNSAWAVTCSSPP